MTSTTRAQITLGVVLMISSTVSWVLMSGLVKVVGENASTNTVAFARFFIGLVTLLPWILKSPIQIFKVPALFTLILRSVFSLGVVIALFYSLRYIPIANALLLNNTFPLVVPVILKCTVRIKIPLPVWLGILLGFIGVAFVLKPTTDFFNKAYIFSLIFFL